MSSGAGVRQASAIEAPVVAEVSGNHEAGEPRLRDENLRAEFQQVVEPWFEERGVPHFSPRYSPQKRVGELVPLLFTVLAFEVAVAPWLDLSVLSLLLSLAMVVFVALCIPWPRGPARDSSTSLLWLLARLVPLGVLGSLLASDAPPLWSDPWVDASVILVGLAASALLFQDDVWSGGGRELVARRRGLVLFVVAGVVAFAVEGSVAPFEQPLSATVGNVLPFVAPVPQALPALVVLALVYTWSRELNAASGGGDADSRDGSPPACARTPTTAALVTAMPLLVILLGAETTVLPHVAHDARLEAVLPLATTLLLAAYAVVVFLRTSRAGTEGHRRSTRLKQAVVDRAVSTHRVSLAAWLLLFLVSYPLLALFFLEIDAFGEKLTGGPAFLVTLAINLLYLAVAWFVVSFGLDRVAVWARREREQIAESVTLGLARGLPLLLVFTAFFGFTAETWEVVIEAGTLAFLGLLALLAGLTVAFVLVTSALELRKDCRFGTNVDLESAALRTKDPEAGPPEGPFREVLHNLTTWQPQALTRSPLKLRGREWVNAMAVLSAYQAFVFIPVTVAAALLFWVLGRLAVPPDVAGTWIYGDGAPASRGAELAARPFIDEPWTRVAMILAIFSVLYLAVTVQSNKEHREEFFQGAERAILQLLAVKLVYDRFLSQARKPSLVRLRRLVRRVVAAVRARWRRPPPERPAERGVHSKQKRTSNATLASASTSGPRPPSSPGLGRKLRAGRWCPAVRRH
jgi:hypothetical protein